MKIKTMITKAKQESLDFGRYAEYFLESEPSVNMPTLRDCFNHNATVMEYQLHMARIKREFEKRQKTS